MIVQLPEKDGFTEGEEITWLGTNDNGVTTYEASVTYMSGIIGSNSFTSNGIKYCFICNFKYYNIV